MEYSHNDKPIKVCEFPKSISFDYRSSEVRRWFIRQNNTHLKVKKNRFFLLVCT